MQKRCFVFVCLALRLTLLYADAPLSCLLTAHAPAVARQGQVVFVRLGIDDSCDGQSFRAQLVYSDGSHSPQFSSYSPPQRRITHAERSMLAAEFADHSLVRLGRSAFIPLGIGTETPVGTAAVLITKEGQELTRTGLVIQKRDFPSETLYLSPALTGIRVDPDPRKDEQAKRYQDVLASADPNAAFLSQGFVFPLNGQRRTSFFGERRIYRYSTGGSARSIHAGVDYGYPTGTPVFAAGAGRVVMAENRISTGWTVIIEHLPGVFTVYMHLDGIDVALGQVLERGQSLGRVGATGLATGPHLHWELRVGGVACDPEGFVGLDKVPDIRTMFGASEGG